MRREKRKICQNVISWKTAKIVQKKHLLTTNRWLVWSNGELMLWLRYGKHQYKPSAEYSSSTWIMAALWIYVFRRKQINKSSEPSQFLYLSTYSFQNLLKFFQLHITIVEVRIRPVRSMYRVPLIGNIHDCWTLCTRQLALFPFKNLKRHWHHPASQQRSKDSPCQLPICNLF